MHSEKTIGDCRPSKTSFGQGNMKALVQDIADRLAAGHCEKAGCADILVVDDNEFNRYLLVQLLSRHGFRCGTVSPFLLSLGR
jgi:hypothetical protein